MRISSTNNSVLGIKTQGQEKKIEVGDTIKGRVTDVSKNNVIIRTSTGQEISASFSNNIDLYLGQPVELSINNIFEDQVFAELRDSNNKNAKLFNLNEKIMNLLKEIDIPIRKDTQDIAKLLIKYDMPVNKETMQRIIELHSSIKNLTQDITPEKLIGLLLVADKANNIPTDILNKAVLLNENNIKGTYINEGIHLESLDNDLGIKDKILTILKDMSIPIDNDMSNLVSKSVSIFEGLSSNDMKNILFLVSNDIDVTPKNLIELANNIKIGDILNKLLDKIDTIDNNVKEFSEIKNDIKKLFITPEKLQNSFYIEDILEDIFALGKKIEEILYKNNFRDVEFNKLLNEVKDKLDFIKAVNENNNYIHMPLLMNDHRSTLDIYLMNDNKKQKKTNNDKSTVLISLDLNNIGHIESMITIERKNVSLVFRTDDNMVKDLINSKLMSLNHLLEEKGYFLTSSMVANIDERFKLNTISNIQRQDKLKDFHLDLRV